MKAICPVELVAVFFIRPVVWVTLLVSLAMRWSPAMAAEAPPENPLEQGKQLTQKAAGILSSNLLAALAKGGATNALEFCSSQAATLTAAAGTNGVTVRRVSHRPRNPANRAAAEDLLVLEQFRARLRPGVGLPPQLTTNANGLVTFYSPIVLNTPLCLNCHGQPGTEVSPVTLEAIRRLYPRDEATAFKLGELRGLWRVDFGGAGKSP